MSLFETLNAISALRITAFTWSDGVKTEDLDKSYGWTVCVFEVAYNTGMKTRIMYIGVIKLLSRETRASALAYESILCSENDVSFA